MSRRGSRSAWGSSCRACGVGLGNGGNAVDVEGLQAKRQVCRLRFYCTHSDDLKPFDASQSLIDQIKDNKLNLAGRLSRQI